jgi:hypothetical protein
VPEIGDIQLTRKLGHGLIVDTAPPRTRIALAVLVDAKWGARLETNDMVNIADQVLYQVVGYDAESASLVLDLVEDWRETYGKPGTAHPVTGLGEGEAGA